MPLFRKKNPTPPRRASVPPSVAALLQRKAMVLGGKEPLPGTPDEVVAKRFDRWIAAEYEKLGLDVPAEYR